VRAGRIATAGLFAGAAASVYLLDTAKDIFDVILQVGAGTGLLYLVRWFWWRVNAWCEVVAMTSSLVVSIALLMLAKSGTHISTAAALMITVATTTICWLLAAYLAPETDRRVLIAFYNKVRPFGPGWTRIRQEIGASSAAADTDSLNIPRALLGWFTGCIAIWSSLFAVGNFLYGRTTQAWLLTGVFAVSAAMLASVVRKLWTGKKS
jgi:hypothetical protein